jgi:DNA-binding response OmpR family regulator
LNPQGVELPLTKLEYALLTAFVAAPGRLLNREHLIGATRLSEDVSDRAVDVQVCRLRRKLKFDPNTPSIIKTERGDGYRFDSAVQQVAFR